MSGCLVSDLVREEFAPLLTEHDFVVVTAAAGLIDAPPRQNWAAWIAMGRAIAWTTMLVISRGPT